MERGAMKGGRDVQRAHTKMELAVRCAERLLCAAAVRGCCARLQCAAAVRVSGVRGCGARLR